MYRYYLVAQQFSELVVPKGYKYAEKFDEKKYIPGIDMDAYGFVIYSSQLTIEAQLRYDLIWGGKLA